MDATLPLPIRTAVALSKILERETESDFAELTEGRSVSFEFLREFNEIRGTMLDYWACWFE